MPPGGWWARSTRVSATAPLSPTPGLPRSGDFDTAVVVLTFASGALGVLDISRVAGYGYDSSAELVGSRATVRIDEPFLHGYEWRTPGTASRPLVQTFDRRYAAAFVAELEHFARSIIDDTPPLVTGADALAAFDLALAADEVMPARPAGEHGGRRPGTFRRPAATVTLPDGLSTASRRRPTWTVSYARANKPSKASRRPDSIDHDWKAMTGQAITDPGRRAGAHGEGAAWRRHRPAGRSARSPGASARCRGGALCCPGTACCRRCDGWA